MQENGALCLQKVPFITLQCLADSARAPSADIEKSSKYKKCPFHRHFQLFIKNT